MSYPTLKLIDPSFSSSITDDIIALEKLRSRRIEGTTPPAVFFQLKNIFHIMESIGSARIEGNRTTVAEYIESKIAPAPWAPREDIREIANMEATLEFIEENVGKYPINRLFLSEIHTIVTSGLQKEGSRTPWEYRRSAVTITNSAHTPPDFTQVSGYMDELFAFIDEKCDAKYDLLKTALVHHRFAWIHPFDNGNGRTVRMLTYAMLMRYGFHVHIWQRLINPTAIFCSDRDAYYDALMRADSAEETHLLDWCQYVLSWLRKETEKLDKLLDYGFLKSRILAPAIRNAKEHRLLTDKEEKILLVALDNGVIQASHIKDIFPDVHGVQISRYIKAMKEKGFLMPEWAESGRKYLISFSNNPLLRWVIQSLQEEGFIAIK